MDGALVSLIGALLFPHAPSCNNLFVSCLWDVLIHLLHIFDAQVVYLRGTPTLIGLLTKPARGDALNHVVLQWRWLVEVVIIIGALALEGGARQVLIQWRLIVHQTLEQKVNASIPVQSRFPRYAIFSVIVAMSFNWKKGGVLFFMVKFDTVCVWWRIQVVVVVVVVGVVQEGAIGDHYMLLLPIRVLPLALHVANHHAEVLSLYLLLFVPTRTLVVGDLGWELLELHRWDRGGTNVDFFIYIHVLPQVLVFRKY